MPQNSTQNADSARRGREWALRILRFCREYRKERTNAKLRLRADWEGDKYEG